MDELRQGLYPPDSMMWRISREAVVLLGGSCALLMQLAHPLVAAGVDQHSTFEQDPVRRLNRTLDLTLRLVFGTREQAMEAARRINRVHHPVRGRLEEATGPVRRGETYAASDPGLLLWVLATLVYAGVATYTTFVRPLSLVERDAYYQDTKRIGGLLGIPAGGYPADWAAFDAYVQGMIEGGPIVVGGTARRLAGSVLRPRVWLVPPIAFEPLAVITAGLLPPALREQYRLAWGPAQRAAFRISRALLPGLVAMAPEPVRMVPMARAARRRLHAA